MIQNIHFPFSRKQTEENASLWKWVPTSAASDLALDVAEIGVKRHRLQQPHTNKSEFQVIQYVLRIETNLFDEMPH